MITSYLSSEDNGQSMDLLNSSDASESCATKAPECTDLRTEGMSMIEGTHALQDVKQRQSASCSDVKTASAVSLDEIDSSEETPTVVPSEAPVPHFELTDKSAWDDGETPAAASTFSQQSDLITGILSHPSTNLGAAGHTNDGVPPSTVSELSSSNTENVCQSNLDDTENFQQDSTVQYSSSSLSSTAVNTIAALVQDFNEKSTHFRRVKFYEAATSSGQWEEKGIGIVTLLPHNGTFDDIRIQVMAPGSDGDVATANIILLDSTILANTNYCLQNKRLVTWMHTPRLRCLSFVKQTACSTFWSLLQLAASDRIGSEDDDDDDENNGDGEDEEDGQQGDCGEEHQEDVRDSPDGTADVRCPRETCASKNCAMDDDEYEKEDYADSIEQSRTLAAQQSTDDDDDEDDGMEQQLKSGGAVLSGGLSSLLEDYEDSVLQHPLDPDGTGQTSASGRLFPPFPLPHTSETLAECLAHIHFIERKAASFPNQVSQTLTCITEPVWLSALWSLLHRAIAASDELLCNSIAELLCRVVSLYAMRSNPFVALAVGPESERFLTPRDPLVRLLSDTHYPNFFRAMEYESELRKHRLKVDHVDFLKHTSQYKEVICRDDEAFRITCHFIYRVMYLRDVCLPRHLDDATIQRLTALINAGYAYLCRIIQLTPNSIAELRDMITEDVTAARFLLQLLSVLRSSVDMSLSLEKYRIFSAIRSERVLEALEGYLTGDCRAARAWRRDMRQRKREQEAAQKRMQMVIQSDVERRHRPHLLSNDRMTIPTLPEIVVDILYLAVEFRPGVLRSAFLRQAAENSSERPTFWYALCDTFQVTDNEGLQIQLAEIFKKLLDPVTVESPERDDFLSIFYDKGVIDRLINILFTPVPLTYHDLIPSDTRHSIEYAAPDSTTCSDSRSSATYRLPYFIPNFSLDDDEDDEFMDDDVKFRSQSTEDDSPLSAASPPTSDNKITPTPVPTVLVSSATKQQPCKMRDTLDDAPQSECHELKDACLYDATKPLCPKRRAVSLTASSGPVREDVGNNPAPAAGAWNVTEGVDDAQEGLPQQYQSYPHSSNNPQIDKSTYVDEYTDSTDPTITSPTLTCSTRDAGALPKTTTSRRSVADKVRRYLESLTTIEREQAVLASRAQLSFAKCRITEILAFCVLKHNSRIKYRNFQQNLHLRVLQISYEPIFDQFLAIYAVKFLRACLVAEADHYARVFIRHNIFRPLLHLLESTLSSVVPRSRSEGSLLESVVLEFFSFISASVDTSPAIPSLVKALFDRYPHGCDALGRFYREVCQYELFNVLRAQYDEMQLSDRRGTLSRSDPGDHRTWSTADQLSGGPTSRSLPPQHSNRRAPCRPLGITDTERDIEESYFELDDDGDTDDYTRAAGTGNFSSSDRSNAPGNNGAVPVQEHSGFPAFLLNAGVDEKDQHEPMLPRFSFSSEEDDDDSDVPSFLKSNNAETKKPAEASHVPGPPRDKPPPLLNLKLCLQPNPSSSQSSL